MAAGFVAVFEGAVEQTEERRTPIQVKAALIGTAHQGPFEATVIPTWAAYCRAYCSRGDLGSAVKGWFDTVGNSARLGDADATMPTALLVSGSLRRLSTNTALLRTTAEIAPDHVECPIYDRLASLPAFNPDDDLDPLPAEVQRLRHAIHRADAIIFSTPEYAGALPGSLKNLLDWTIGDEHAGSIYEKPVAWINASPRGADGAHQELRTVLGYAHARVIETACAHVPVMSQMVGADGLVDDDASKAALARVLTEVFVGVR
jgi:NAD(P)H-dependent FMN reductase